MDKLNTNKTELEKDRKYYVKSKVWYKGFKSYKISKQLLSFSIMGKLKGYPVFIFYNDGINDIHIISEDCIVDIREAVLDKHYGTYSSGKLINFKESK